MRWLFSVVVGVLIGISALTMTSAKTSANAQPVPPPPGPTQPGGSTTEELADMVLDVIEHDSAAIPTPSPDPAP